MSTLLAIINEIRNYFERFISRGGQEQQQTKSKIEFLTAKKSQTDEEQNGQTFGKLDETLEMILKPKTDPYPPKNEHFWNQWTFFYRKLPLQDPLPCPSRRSAAEVKIRFSIDIEKEKWRSHQPGSCDLHVTNQVM